MGSELWFLLMGFSSKPPAGTIPVLSAEAHLCWLKMKQGANAHPQLTPFYLRLLLGPMSVGKFESSSWGPEASGGRPQGAPQFYSPLLPPGEV